MSGCKIIGFVWQSFGAVLRLPITLSGCVEFFNGLKAKNMKYEIEMTEQDIKDLRAVRNYFGENDRTMFEHKAYAILDRLVKKLNTPRVSNPVCPKCKSTNNTGLTYDNKYCCLDCSNLWAN